MAYTKDNIFEEWLAIADEFKAKLDATLDEVSHARNEVMQVKSDIMNQLNEGQYLWDKKRIVISAPEIIIGHVDRNGDYKGGGHVRICGTGINVDGVSEGGNVNITAPRINEVAANPGIDGIASIVGSTSSITQVARNIVFDSQNPKEAEGRGATFLDTPSAPGITLHADTAIDIQAVKSKKQKEKAIEDCKKKLTKMQKQFTSDIADVERSIAPIMMGINSTLKREKIYSATDDFTRANVLAIDELHTSLQSVARNFDQLYNEMIDRLTRLAEVNRRIKCLENEDKELGKIDDEKFKKDAHDTSVNIQSEKISLNLRDGDNQWRLNEKAGIELQGNNIQITSALTNGELPPTDAQSRIYINSRNVDIGTLDTKATFNKETGEIDEATFTPTGTVIIQSKIVNFDAIDMHLTKDGKLEETKLATDSQVNVRTANFKVNTHNEKGEASGKFCVNSKAISMKSSDIDEYKTELTVDDQNNVVHQELKDKGVAKDSEMLLLSDQINVGFKNKKMAAKTVNVISNEKTLIHSNKENAVAAGPDFGAKSSVELKDAGVDVLTEGSAVVSGKGGVKIQGEVNLNSKLTGTDIEAKNVKGSSSVAGPNMADGMAVAGAKGSTKACTKQELKDSEL